MMNIKNTVNYPIRVGEYIANIFYFLKKKSFYKIVIITDHTVKNLYGLYLQKILKQSNYDCFLFSFPAGEKYKTHQTKQKIENTMLRYQCDKNTFIISLGGGVVGDLAGFIAATYLRGVDYIQIPTTLLAMVDSSIGGKTGINTIYGKNLIGAIYQPMGVVIDINFLKSLSEKNRINGLIEAIKIFLIADEKMFNCFDRSIKKTIAQAIKIKAAIVSRDEKENGERNLLNFGHTIGHALEKLSNYRLLHGYAVGYGLLVEANISCLMGLLDNKQLDIIKNLLSRLGIHGKYLKKYTINQVIQATQNDKKIRFGKVNYVLLDKIGSAYSHSNRYIHPVTDKIVRQALKNTMES